MGVVLVSSHPHGASRICQGRASAGGLAQAGTKPGLTLIAQIEGGSSMKARLIILLVVVAFVAGAMGIAQGVAAPQAPQPPAAQNVLVTNTSGVQSSG